MDDTREEETAVERGLELGLDGCREEIHLYRVEITLSFLTGIELDPASMLTPSQSDRRSSTLAAASGVPFYASKRQERADRRFYAIVDSEHGTEVLPSSVARVDSGWLLEKCAAGTTEGWALVDAQMDLHDFGVGSAQLAWEPAAATSTTAGPAVVDLVALLDSAASTLLATATAAVVSAFADALGSAAASRDAELDVVLSDERLVPSAGRILWASAHLRTTTTGDHRRAAEALAQVVCPNDFRTLAHRDHSYVAATSVCVTCSYESARADAIVHGRVIQNQDAWWTLYWSLDRRLLALQMDISSRASSYTLKELEGRTRAMARIHERMGLYLSRIDSMLASAGARELAVWDNLAAAWTLPYRRRCVDRKLVQLRESYSSALAEIEQTRAARVNVMIFIFTAFGVVASAVAVAEFIEAKPNDSLAIRLAVFALCAAIALGSVSAALRSGARRSRVRSAADSLRPWRAAGPRADP